MISLSNLFLFKTLEYVQITCRLLAFHFLHRMLPEQIFNVTILAFMQDGEVVTPQKTVLVG